MRVASLWKHEKTNSSSTPTTWLGHHITTLEFDFPLSAVFLTKGVPPGKLLDWAATNTTGRISIRNLDDGRGVIAVSSKFDAFMLKSDFADHLDLAVVSTSSSPEKIRDVLKFPGRKKL